MFKNELVWIRKNALLFYLFYLKVSKVIREYWDMGIWGLGFSDILQTSNVSIYARQENNKNSF